MPFVMAHPWLTFFLGLAALGTIGAVLTPTPRITINRPGGGQLTQGRRWIVSGTGVRQIA
jgi:hypothetical protein